MAAAQIGDTVRVHYSGKFEDGTQFDSSEGRAPLEFTIGAGQIIPGFEEVVVGMEPGESRTTVIAPDKGYGPRRTELTMEVGRAQLPPDLEPEVGQRLQLTRESGGSMMVMVTEVNDESITLDANHPLAGQSLTFDIQLVEIA